MKKYIIAFVLLLASCLAQAQDPDKGTFTMQTGDYHSPEVQAITRYGQIPVSYFTGTAQINIPLYETEVGGLKFGISINYNSSGIKVDDIASVAGLGWVLNAGGVISRTVHGLPDETPGRGFLDHILTDEDLTYDYNRQYLYDTTNPSAIDCSADEFTYTFMGHSGKFSFGPDGEIHLLPFCDLKFDFSDRTSFKVQTEEGHTFIFDETEMTVMNSNGYTAAVTAWHLGKIILNNNGGEIIFSYIAGASYEDRFPSYSSSYVDMHVTSGIPEFHSNFAANLNGTILSFNHIMTSAKYLSEIKMGTLGRIVFEYDDNAQRLDFLSGKILRSIKAYNAESSVLPVRHWEFSQDITLCEAGYNSSLHYNSDRYRMFLTSVSEVSDNTDKQTYRMEYDPTPLPCRKTFGKDLWGYYNGAYYNSNGIYINPDDAATVSGLKFPNGINHNRKGNEKYLKAGSLVKLIYPTGGYTFFEYEGHQISTDEKAGGLRIKSIKNHSDGELVESRFFAYGLNEDGLARVSSFNYNKNFKRLRGGYFFPEPAIHTTNSASYTLYTLTDNPYYPSYIGYEQVTEYRGTEQSPAGKVEYRYDFKMDDLADSYGSYPNSGLFISNIWQNGNCKEIKTYAKTDSGYEPVRKETNVYKRYTVSQAKSYCANILFVYNGATWGSGASYQTGFADEQEYAVTLVPAISETMKKTTTEVTDYFRNGSRPDSLVTVTRYGYEGLERIGQPHGFLTKAETVFAGGNDSLCKEYRYLPDVVSDLSNNKNAVYREMYERNMNARPLEIITLRNGKVIQSQVNLFRKDANGNIVQKEQKTLETSTPLSNYIRLSIASAETADSRLATNVVYLGYTPRGNLTEHCKRDNISTVTLWSYSNQYPVFRIEGATYEEVKTALTQTAINNLMNNPNPSFAEIQSRYLTLVSHFSGKPVMITAFAYKPFVGMSARIAPNQEITTYEYDKSGRLVTVKDHNGKIMEQHHYHYKTN